MEFGEGNDWALFLPVAESSAWCHRWGTTTTPVQSFTVEHLLDHLTSYPISSGMVSAEKNRKPGLWSHAILLAFISLPPRQE